MKERFAALAIGACICVLFFTSCGMLANKGLGTGVLEPFIRVYHESGNVVRIEWESDEPDQSYFVYTGSVKNISDMELQTGSISESKNRRTLELENVPYDGGTMYVAVVPSDASGKPDSKNALFAEIESEYEITEPELTVNLQPNKAGFSLKINYTAAKSGNETVYGTVELRLSEDNRVLASWKDCIPPSYYTISKESDYLGAECYARVIYGSFCCDSKEKKIQ